jgi:thiamine transport system permease protein
MARGAFAVIRAVPAVLTAGLVVGLTLGTLLAVAFRIEAAVGLSTGDWAALRFTVMQAFISAVLSVGLAIPVARALARRRFAGRSALVSLLGAPFILPVIVAVFGLLAVFGRGGLANLVLSWVGASPVSIYGFHGVVLAHVFFNMPLATRMVLQGWLAIPAEGFRLAASLNAPVGRILERPMLWAVLPGAFLVIFLICLTSFAVALTLGGGPRATTVELAIYQALRFDFDPGKAALLAALQFGLCAAAAALAGLVSLPEGFGAGMDRIVIRWDSTGRAAIVGDTVIIALAALFLLLPLAMVVGRGAAGLGDLPAAAGPALLCSLAVAAVSTCLTLALALALALRRNWWVGPVGALPLAASPLVMGTGLFVIIYPLANPTLLALPVTALVNAVLALPFALRIIAPAVAQIEASYGPLADTLGLAGSARLRWLILPRLRRPLGFAAGLAAALSMGDLGVIALFAGDGQATLPLVMYRLMGSYRMEAAAGVGLLLLGATLTVFWLCDRGGRVDADA